VDLPLEDGAVTEYFCYLKQLHRLEESGLYWVDDLRPTRVLQVHAQPTKEPSLEFSVDERIFVIPH